MLPGGEVTHGTEESLFRFTSFIFRYGPRHRSCQIVHHTFQGHAFKGPSSGSLGPGIIDTDIGGKTVEPCFKGPCGPVHGSFLEDLFPDLLKEILGMVEVLPEHPGDPEHNRPSSPYEIIGGGRISLSESLFVKH